MKAIYRPSRYIPTDVREMFIRKVNEFQPLCPVCGKRIKNASKMAIGHIVSNFNGGTTDLDNLVAVHRATCNFGIDTILFNDVDINKCLKLKNA